jgi:hypothetical protein
MNNLLKMDEVFDSGGVCNSWVKHVVYYKLKLGDRGATILGCARLREVVIIAVWFMLDIGPYASLSKRKQT